MIIKEDIDDKLIETSLKRCLNTFTYVSLDDRLFWDKSLLCLSDRKKMEMTRIENVLRKVSWVYLMQQTVIKGRFLS